MLSFSLISEQETAEPETFTKLQVPSKHEELTPILNANMSSETPQKAVLYPNAIIYMQKRFAPSQNASESLQSKNNTFPQLRASNSVPVINHEKANKVIR